MLFLAPALLRISTLETAILGTVIAAVSLAVIVPKMLKLMDEYYGVDKGIPQLILAGASVDDVFVIVLFTFFTGLASIGTFASLELIRIPTAIILGVIGGVFCGVTLAFIFKKIHIRDSLKFIIILSVSFLLVTLEHTLIGIIGFSGLLAVIRMGVTILKTSHKTAIRACLVSRRARSAPSDFSPDVVN